MNCGTSDNFQSTLQVHAFSSVGEIISPWRMNERPIDRHFRAVRRELRCSIEEASDGIYVKFEDLPDEGILYWTIMGQVSFEILGGEYISDISEDLLNPVNIALGICTFKREPFIRRNIRRLIQDILENKESPLCGHLQVFIADVDDLLI